MAPKTAVQQAVPAPPPAVPEEPVEPDKATITLRLADRDADKEHALQAEVEPGQRQRVLALVRNQSGIVDNYQLRVEGLPDDWWSIYPDTVYLVPFGTGGTYEQEVEIHLHPPKAPSAEAKLWDLQVVAHSKAHEVTAASAPLGLQIKPYVETTTKVRPERKSGRRKATYGVMVENKANAPVLVALEGEDPDGELAYGFNRPPTEIPPGETVQASMQVRPPKQIWIGRPQERRFSVTTLTGEKAQERLAEEPVSAEELRAQAAAAPAKRRWWKRGSDDIPGVYGPRVYKPQVYEPGLNIGPGGISLRKPQLRAPSMQGPGMKQMNVDMAGLKSKLPGGGAPAAPAGPLLPSQAVFRQKPWLPWWLVPVGIALAALAVMLYLLLPQNVVVPEVVGSASAFEAEEKLTEAELTLAPAPKEKVDPDAEPGSVISQTPKAGEKAEKGAPVTIQIAVGDGQITVPKVTGLTLADAEAALREKKLTLGQTSPQPPDPDGTIESQIPAENEIVKEGAPVDVFFADPNGKGEGKEKEAKKDGPAPAGGEDAGAEGANANAEIVIPAIAGAELDEFAQKLGDDGLVPQAKRQFDDSKAGTLFATEPPGGTTVKAGTKVTLLVSAGFPRLAFDDDKNIRLVDGASGDKLDPIAKTGTREKDPAWSPDGSRVAYAGGGRVFLKNLEKPDEPAVTLTGPDEDFNDLAWAPTADVNLLAMSRVKGDDRDLCLGQITQDGMTPRCISNPDIQVGTVIRWRPDGKEILTFGVEDLGTFGMVRYRSKKAFSPDPKDWKGGKIVTDTSKSGEGVLDASYSPDGSRMAIVSNQGGGPFQVFLAKKNDLLLTSAKPTDVRACQAIWRSDGRDLVVVQKDETCQEPVGDLLRLAVRDPSKQTQLNASGDNPVFQPLTLGG